MTLSKKILKERIILIRQEYESWLGLHSKIKLLKKKNIGIVAITAYDASFARYFDELGFDIILIGDSLGEVIKGQKNTHNVSLENMIYHSQSVRRAVKNSYLISDLPENHR